MSALARCVGCQKRPVAWRHPRVDYCYQCLPGGPFAPPPCRRCGSDNYFTGGLCEACHPDGPKLVGSCRGCLAWGVYRQYNWHCWSCRWWQTHFPTGTCRYCRRETPIGELGACRLCMEHARHWQQPGRAIDLPDANRFGQQLFLANRISQRRRAQPLTVRMRVRQARPAPVPWRQLPLFSLAPDVEVIKKQAVNTDQDLGEYCKDIVAEHSSAHGWSKRQTNDVIRSLRVLHLLQDTPGAKLTASEVLRARRYDGNIVSTLEVLAGAGLLIDDRVSNIQRYFVGKANGLPDKMTTELQLWLDVRLKGRRTAPRLLPRLPQTVQIQLGNLAPVVQSWAARGYTSLAQVTTADVQAALPPSGAPRAFTAQALRSLFTILKAHKIVFANPTRGLRVTQPEPNIPLPLKTEQIREALNSTVPAIALAVALVAFHALTTKQTRHLKLTDIVDGRLTIDGRQIPLAAPVQARLTAWLDYRARTWPGTLNPHLLISRKTGPRLTPVGPQFAWQRLSFTAQSLREDRILQEIHAHGGDVRRVCDLFGLGIEAAMRYTLTLGEAQSRKQPPVPRTRTIN